MEEEERNGVGAENGGKKKGEKVNTNITSVDHTK